MLQGHCAVTHRSKPCPVLDKWLRLARPVSVWMRGGGGGAGQIHLRERINMSSLIGQVSRWPILLTLAPLFSCSGKSQSVLHFPSQQNPNTIGPFPHYWLHGSWFCLTVSFLPSPCPSPVPPPSLPPPFSLRMLILLFCPCWEMTGISHLAERVILTFSSALAHFISTPIHSACTPFSPHFSLTLHDTFFGSPLDCASQGKAALSWDTRTILSLSPLLCAWDAHSAACSRTLCSHLYSEDGAWFACLG